MKKKLIRRILAVAVIATFLIGTMSFAQESDTEIPREEMQVIDADDIGVETMDHFPDVTKKVKVVNEDADIETENPAVDETPVYVEEVENEEPAEAEKEDTLPEETEPVEEEDLSEPPEGMYEGYEEGIYLPINNYECEQHEGCYKCEKCTYERTLSYDEELETYIGEETCIVCGHGTCVEITEEEVDDYVPVVDEEESEE